MFSSTQPDELKTYVDVEQGLARIRGNTKVYKAMMGSFERDTSYQKLLDAIAAGDMNGAEAHAHSLKGIAANLSFTALYETSTELDSKLKNGESDDALVASLSEIMEKTLKYAAWVKAELI